MNALNKLTACLVLAVSFCLDGVHCQDFNTQSVDNVENEAQYAVFFTDKDNSPYSVNEPLEFLSQRALDRREKRGIAVNEDDLPVNPSYVNSLKNAGAYVKWTSRWANLAMIHASDEMIEEISQMEMVDSVVYIKPSEMAVKNNVNPYNKWNEITYKPVENNDACLLDYGFARSQIMQVNGNALHEAGLTGEGVMIAVIDAGFKNVNEMQAFTHLYESGRIVYELDVVDIDGDIYAYNVSDHGTSVLSTMGAYQPGLFIGTAPDAEYALIRTEDSDTEYLVEEYNFLIGAEAADSIGADVVNTSLGYSTFDDPSMEQPYSDMDGNTAISSIAAKMMIERGVHFVTSAGNSNGSEWPWVGTPSDVVEGLTIGAVDANGNIAYFSSIGPNGGGDQKPNTVANGYGCFVIRPNGNVETSSGTSFSSPITCGLVACLVGANPYKTTDEIKSSVEQFADRFNNPDYYYGYGLPDFGATMNSLVDGLEYTSSDVALYVFPNPTQNVVNVVADNQISKIQVLDVLGRCLETVVVNDNKFCIDLSEYSSNFCVLNVLMNDGSSVNRKVIVTR